MPEPQLLYCSACGRQFETDFNGWAHPLALARACCKECYDHIDDAWQRCLHGKPDPQLAACPESVLTL